MDCSQTIFFNNREHIERLNRKIEDERIPFSGSIDLTRRCNLHCIHCYLAESASRPVGSRELSTQQIRSIIDEITEAGCLFLLITGGEPLLRKDFSEIYCHAKSNGLLLTIFTNGTLITESVADLFSELPPYSVEISLYGATASTYEKITGIKGSYNLCIKGIQILLRNKINVQLKTMLMSINSHELSSIEDLAKNFGVRFRFDAAVFPRMDGDKTPLNYRVSPEDAVHKELSDPVRYRDWQEYVLRNNGNYVTENLYVCGAGSTNFHIDSYGNLQPCLMTHNVRYDLLRGNFLSGWYTIYESVKQRRVRQDFSCKGCEKVAFCNYCPAFFFLENGAEDICSEYLCRLGSLRHAGLKNTENMEVVYGE